MAIDAKGSRSGFSGPLDVWKEQLQFNLATRGKRAYLQLGDTLRFNLPPMVRRERYLQFFQSPIVERNEEIRVDLTCAPSNVRRDGNGLTGQVLSVDDSVVSFTVSLGKWNKAPEPLWPEFPLADHYFYARDETTKTYSILFRVNSPPEIVGLSNSVVRVLEPFNSEILVHDRNWDDTTHIKILSNPASAHV